MVYYSVPNWTVSQNWLMICLVWPVLPSILVGDYMGMSSSQLTNSIIFQRGGSTTRYYYCLLSKSVHHGKSPKNRRLVLSLLPFAPFQCLSESMSLALKKKVKSPSSIVSPWYPKAFPWSFIFFLPVCLVSLVVQIQIIIHHSLHSNSINMKYQQMIIFSWILMKVYTISNSLVVQHPPPGILFKIRDARVRINWFFYVNILLSENIGVPDFLIL